LRNNKLNLEVMAQGTTSVGINGQKFHGPSRSVDQGF